MAGVAELQYHGLSAGRADAPQQTGITLDLSNYNVFTHVVHYELHSRLGETEREREIARVVSIMSPQCSEIDEILILSHDMNGACQFNQTNWRKRRERGKACKNRSRHVAVISYVSYKICWFIKHWMKGRIWFLICCKVMNCPGPFVSQN